MGVETRRPPLPAPTESSTLQPSGGEATPTDIETDVSRRTDHTSVSIPEDGSPVTITTKKRAEREEKERARPPLGRSHQSQTSLLIEYFEAGKGPNVHNRPSVRVKVTPSAARKIKDTKDHIQITEAGGNRKTSYTRRISLGPTDSGDRQITDVTDDRSISSLAEDSNLSSRYPPVEIEVMRQDQNSDLSADSAPLGPRYANINPSEISSMPADSMLEGDIGQQTPKRTRSRSMGRGGESGIGNTLKAPSRRRSRSLSRDRLVQKAVEKLGKPKEVSSSSKRKQSSGKGRSRSISQEQLVENSKSARRRSSRPHAEEGAIAEVESSIATDSVASHRRKSGDQYSVRSETSRSSVNNPKLLADVEHLIKRLILPELSTLKQAQKNQHNRDRFERESVASGSTGSREVARKVSKHASAPDFASKPKVVLNQDDENEGLVLSGNSVKGRKVSREKRDYDSPSQRSFERGESEETVVRGEKVAHRKSKDDHRLRDAAAAGLTGGVLTAAALHHHDSKSSVEKGRRRRRRSSSSKSHGRSASYGGSVEEIFDKHDIPPMPMRSDIHGSEVTRDSILSEKTEEPSTPTSERRRSGLRNVFKGSPKQLFSPGSRTPTRTPDRRTLDKMSEYSLRDSPRRSTGSRNGLNGSAIASDLQASDLPLSEGGQSRRQSYSDHAAERGLSPIQSVDSLPEDEQLKLSNYKRDTRTSGSLGSMNDAHRKHSSTSIKSLSSLASTNVARRNRPEGINLEDGRIVLDQHNLDDRHAADSPRSAAMEDWYEKQHQENDRYRESMAGSSLQDDASYEDQVTAKPVQDLGANPEFVHTPIGVESAVASLMDPSTVSTQSKGLDTSYEEYGGSEPEHRRDHLDVNDEYHQNVSRGVSPLSERQFNDGGRSRDSSPRQSIAKSVDDQEPPVTMSANALPTAEDDMPAIGHRADSEESEVNTNPSIIQGPIGGTPHGELNHWPYDPTPHAGNAEFIPRNNDQTAQQNLKAAAAGMLGAAALAGRDRAGTDTKSKSPQMSLRNMEEETYQPRLSQDIDPAADAYNNERSLRSPSVMKDEGYISAAPQQSAGQTPEDSTKGLQGLGLSGNVLDDISAAGDPFLGATGERRLSGYSQGMPSPLYDSATGGGLDRIQSKDIVALMDHLTVRDAQRNARDTEILVTLVRSAAEMRNSFEDMKRFITEQDDMILDETDRQHEDTVKKVIGGPRPQPGLSRTPQRPGTDDSMDEKASKKQNVFKRALKGLGSKNASDLTRMEAMLVQLLGEVETLKANQEGRSSSSARRQGSYSPYNVQTPRDDGYEPEGRAGTSSTGQSGYFSHSPVKPMRSNEGRKMSGTRISTVLEGDEDLEPHEEEVLNQGQRYEDEEDDMPTPTRESFRGGSVPSDTPPRDPPMTTTGGATQSAENTPHTGGTDKSRKHKSSSSSFFPKMYSRWSKTTASTNYENNRLSQPPPMPTQQQHTPRQRPLSEASRSGSSLGDGGYNVEDHYNPTGADRLRSQNSLLNDDDDDDDPNNLNRLDSPSQEARPHSQTSRPRSPLIPSTVSDNNPKYQAHRNSLNLQHPQPRPGPTHRYQTALEHQASAYPSTGGSPGPVSPSSDQWGSNPTLARYSAHHPPSSQRYSGNTGNLSPINSDAGYSDVSAAEERMASEQRVMNAGPPRPPKIRDDGKGPLIPARKEVAKSPLGPERELERERNREMERERDSYASASQEATNHPDNASPQSTSSPNAAARNRGVPQRKPTGPRPITSSGNYSPDKVAQLQRTRYRGSPNHVESSSGEDVTF